MYIMRGMILILNNYDGIKSNFPFEGRDLFIPVIAHIDYGVAVQKGYT